jgi:hypothetical protein
MIDWHQGCVLLHEGRKLLGILTERDLLRYRLRPEWSPELSMLDMMTPDPVTVDIETDLLKTIDILQTKGRRRLPVVDHTGELIGLVTQTGLLNQMAMAVRSRQAVLNPEDILEPAIWFSPHEGHAIQAMNRLCAELLSLDPHTTIGQSIAILSPGTDLWDAIVVLLHYCGRLGPLQLSLRTGTEEHSCMLCQFLLVHTPTGDDRVFCTFQMPMPDSHN